MRVRTMTQPAVLKQQLTRLRKEASQLRDELTVVERDLRVLSQRYQRDHKPVFYDLCQITAEREDETDLWPV